MPYIKQESRSMIDKDIKTIVDKIQLNGQLREQREGVLNYTISRLLHSLYPNDKYSEFNNALGVLDAVAREFYRRRVAPYEEEKIKSNGDVY